MMNTEIQTKLHDEPSECFSPKQFSLCPQALEHGSRGGGSCRVQATACVFKLPLLPKSQVGQRISKQQLKFCLF